MPRLSLGFLVISLALTACRSSQADREWTQVSAGTWLLLTLENEPVVPDSRVTLRLEAPSRLFGEGGINSYFGTFERLGEYGLRTGSIASTKKAGPAELMDQESRYLRLLSEVDGMRLARGERDATLELTDGAEVVLTFVPLR